MVAAGVALDIPGVRVVFWTVEVGFSRVPLAGVRVSCSTASVVGECVGRTLIRFKPFFNTGFPGPKAKKAKA